MTPFEEDLKKALARSEPSADFTARVLAQVSAAPVRRPSTQHGMIWQWAAAAAATIVLASGVLYQHHEHEMRGEAAKNKLLIAMKIAGSKLHLAQERVQEIESPQVNQ